MSAPMSTTQLLEAILFNVDIEMAEYGFDVEAEAAWFPKSDGDITEGEAQAVVRIAERRYAISLERLP